MRQFILIFLLTLGLSAKIITPNDVYAQVMLITQEMHFLQNYYDIKPENEKTIERVLVNSSLKPRNVWQMTYEISIKMNMLRVSNKLPIIKPVNMEPVLNLNPDLVYEQTQRILTELRIYKYRMGIKPKTYKNEVYKNKTPLDVFNALSHISAEFDKLNHTGFTPSYVFGETMRVYDDLTTILNYLHISDETIPAPRNDKATPSDTFNVAMQILDKINQIQLSVRIDTVDFSIFKKEKLTPSDVFTINQMILAELQTIKAYVGLNHYVTPAATVHIGKTPADVEQLMNWNLRKVSLIKSLANRLR